MIWLGLIETGAPFFFGVGAGDGDSVIEGVGVGVVVGGGDGASVAVGVAELLGRFFRDERGDSSGVGVGEDLW